MAPKAPLAEVGDRVSTYEAVSVALSTLADGSLYIWDWGRPQDPARGRGSLLVTRSFLNSKNSVCRHIELTLTSAERTKKLEGVACRLPGGRWSLAG